MGWAGCRPIRGAWQGFGFGSLFSHSAAAAVPASASRVFGGNGEAAERFPSGGDVARNGGGMGWVGCPTSARRVAQGAGPGPEPRASTTSPTSGACYCGRPRAGCWQAHSPAGSFCGCPFSPAFALGHRRTTLLSRASARWTSTRCKMPVPLAALLLEAAAIPELVLASMAAGTSGSSGSCAGAGYCFFRWPPPPWPWARPSQLRSPPRQLDAGRRSQASRVRPFRS